VNTSDAISRNHFGLMFIAVQKPASKPVVIHVARKKDREYIFASGSGHSRPTILAKFRLRYSQRKMMTVVCHVVNLPVNREERLRINGGPCLSALSCSSLDLGAVESRSVIVPQ
jgi:hypothetical protein